MVNDIASGDVTIFTLIQIQIFMLRFADDTMLFAETAADPQILLDNLKVYCDKWNISVNMNKSKIVLFKNGNPRINCTLYFNNREVEIVQSFTYLGVILTSNGKFVQAQKVLAEKGNKALFTLNKLVDKADLNFSEKKKWFDDFTFFESWLWDLGFSSSTECWSCSSKFSEAVITRLFWTRVALQPNACELQVDFKLQFLCYLTLLKLVIGIINFERLSPNFIADTMNWFLNSLLD